MIIDVTGCILIPGNQGVNCPGNGEHKNPDGKLIECCCDECNWMMCCLETHSMSECSNCDDPICPNSPLTKL